MDYWPAVQSVPGVKVAIDVRDDGETWIVTRDGAEILRLVCEPYNDLVTRGWRYRVTYRNPAWFEVAKAAGVDPDPVL